MGDDADTAHAPDAVRRRGRVCLQDAARRARAGARRPGRARRRRPPRRAWRTATTPRPCASTAAGPSSPPPTSSPPSSTTPTTGAASPPPTPSRTSTPWAAPRWSRSTCCPGRARRSPSTSPPRCCAAAPTCAPRPGAFLGGGHSVDDPEPKYGQAVTGLADADRLLRNDAGEAGLPLTLTKPLGLGVLNNRHKATGERFEEAVAPDDHAQPRRLPRRARPRRALRHRRHRLRPARAPVQARPRQRRERRHRRRRRPLRRRRPAGARGRATSRAAAGATSTGSARTCARR